MPYTLNQLGAADDPTVLKNSEELGQVTFFRWVTIIFIVQAFLFKVSDYFKNVTCICQDSAFFFTLHAKKE